MDIVDQLADAYLNGEAGFRFVYHLQTKEVYVPLEDEEWEEEDDIVAVPYKDSREMYEVMVEFTQQFSGEIEEALYRALNSRKPFRTFKESAIEMNVIEQWYVFEQNYAKQQIQQWLRELEVE